MMDPASIAAYYLGRIAYTKVKHRGGTPDLPLASNAILQMKSSPDLLSISNAVLDDENLPPPPTYEQAVAVPETSPGNISPRGSVSSSSDDAMIQLDSTSATKDEEPQSEVAEKELCNSVLENPEWLPAKGNSLTHPIAVFPQYLASDTTTLLIRESHNPFLRGNFSVSLSSDGTEKELLSVRHTWRTLRHDQTIVDVRTGEPVAKVRRDFATLPRSLFIKDTEDKVVVDVRGEFHRPTKGAKATVHLTNAMDGEKFEIAIRASWRNVHAVLEDKKTGQILASVGCNAWSKVTGSWGYRTYVVCIRSGVDMALVTGLVLAMDDIG